GLDMWHTVQKLYLDPSIPLAEISHPEHMPVLPKEMAVISASVLQQIKDLSMKAVVSGSSYTTKQAMEDAHQVWESNNGEQLLEWYREWYKTESQNAILAKDIYEIMVQQKK